MATGVTFDDVKAAALSAVEVQPAQGNRAAVKQLKEQLDQLERQALVYLAEIAASDPWARTIWAAKRDTPSPKEMTLGWSSQMRQQQNVLTLLKLLQEKIRRRCKVRTLVRTVFGAVRLLSIARDRLIADLGEADWKDLSDGLAWRTQEKLIETWQQLRRVWCLHARRTVCPIAWAKLYPAREFRRVFLPTLADVERILAEVAKEPRCGPAVYLAILLAVFFGVREDECVKLCLGHLQWGRTLEIYVLGKGEKPRTIRALHVPENVLTCLRETWSLRMAQTQNRAAALLLVDAAGQALTGHRLLRHLQAAAERTGVCSAAEAVDLDFHRLRHLCANRLLALGEPLMEVARYLGHADPLTTLQSYAHNLYQLDPVDAALAETHGAVLTGWVPLRWLAAQLGLTLAGAEFKLAEYERAVGRRLERRTTKALGLKVKKAGRSAVCLSVSEVCGWLAWLVSPEVK